MTNPAVSAYVHMINRLHDKWTPHVGQLKVGQQLLKYGKDLFIQCGRNWGKSELICYLMARWAYQKPGSENYYFAPFAKQAGEILWENRRIQNFVPQEWIASTNDTEMRIKLKNGSFIKLDGSDNVEAYRGVKPRGLICYEEFKDFRPEFYDAFDPNRAPFNAPLVILGTPPERECQYLAVAEEFKQGKNKYFYHAPTRENPHISREWLKDKEAEYVRKGEYDVWQREYEALYVPGGVSKIFPQLTRDVMVPHADLMARIRRDRTKLEWFAIADPAAATVFGVIFAAINPYTRKIYILDCIYETNRMEMTVQRIGTRILQTLNELTEGDHRCEARKVYDEAAAWFANEMLDHFNDHWEPTRKAQRKKEDGLSLIRDVLSKGNVEISTRAEKLYWEMDNYYTDKTGKIPKVNDHLIDDFRYLLDASYYDLNTLAEKNREADDDFRGARISHDYPDLDDMGAPVGEGDLISTMED